MNTAQQHVLNYTEETQHLFSQERKAFLQKLSLEKLLEEMSPYFWFRQQPNDAVQIVTKFLDAALYSNEETLFGNWLEGLAIFVNQKVFGGWKSGITGIDLEFDNENTRYIVAVKSGPNWGNSSQIAKMKSDFNSAKKTLRTSNSKLHIEAINGCCYGRDDAFNKGDYYKYCGQRFWAFISGNDELYTEIIEPLGHTAMERNKEFIESFSKMRTKFVRDFLNQFCLKDGSIDWIKLVRFNSGKEKE
ncbi:MAG: hypothetical protein FWC50_04160 [Planctomycetaceae bacterium]|nr:hypothetical protein [Planctomycetaceae bacterium]